MFILKVTAVTLFDMAAKYKDDEQGNSQEFICVQVDSEIYEIDLKELGKKEDAYLGGE